MREAIGDENVPIKIKKIDPWILRESVAKSFQDGRDILLVGIFQLLDSFAPERQPVGTKLVKASTKGFASHIVVWEALGTFAPTYEEGKAE